MTKPVVVAVSFENHWGPMGGIAAALAEARGTDLRLVHVGDPDEDVKELGWGDMLVEWFDGMGVRAEMVWETGNPGQVLLAHAYPGVSSALVLGTCAAHNATLRGFLGSTVSRVLREGSGLLAVVPDEGRAPKEKGSRKVLFPTDLSEASLGVLDDVGGLAGGLGGELHLLNVVRRPTKRGVWIEEEIPPSQDERINLAHARSELKRLRSRVGGEAEVNAVLAETPAHGVVDEAERIDADLIAMPSRGAGLVSRVVLGSVADAVVRMAKRPVLVFK